MNWNGIVPGVFGVLTAILAAFQGCVVSGCTAPMGSELERTQIRLMTEVVMPAVKEATKDTVANAAQLQGGVQAIEPGYAVHVEGVAGWCFKGDATVKVTGVAGQLQGSMAATEPEKKPYEPRR